MSRKMILILLGVCMVISCHKKEESRSYELACPKIDTLVIGSAFTPPLYITSPPAKVSFYLDGPIDNFKGEAGDFFFDNTSDSLYIRDDMRFIKEISSFEKNNYNKKYWRIPFDWVPEAPSIEANKIYCLIIQGDWQVEGVPHTTIGNYVYIKGD